MTFKILFLFYRQTWLLFLLIHGATAFLARNGDLGDVIALLLFLKAGQYFSIYFYYRRFNTFSLILYMNLGVRLKWLFASTYVFDLLLLVLTLILVKE